jgi:hypothetical protein
LGQIEVEAVGIYAGQTSIGHEEVPALPGREERDVYDGGRVKSRPATSKVGQGLP